MSHSLQVSIFLRENLQTQQGLFIINTSGTVPNDFQPPGEIRFVDMHIDTGLIFTRGF
jgi:hypothetical protein